MKKLFVISATLALAAPALTMPALAATATKPTPKKLKEAQQTLSLIVSALNSKDVPQETKNGLFGCLYENSLGKIADGAAQVLAHNPKIDLKDPNVRLLVIAKVCGAPVPTAKAPAKGKGG